MSFFLPGTALLPLLCLPALQYWLISFQLHTVRGLLLAIVIELNTNQYNTTMADITDVGMRSFYSSNT